MSHSPFTSSQQQNDAHKIAHLLAPIQSLRGVQAARARLLTRVVGGTRVIDMLFCPPDHIVDRRFRPSLGVLEKTLKEGINPLLEERQFPCHLTHFPPFSLKHEKNTEKIYATVCGIIQEKRPPAPHSRQPWQIILDDGTGLLDIIIFSPWQAKQCLKGNSLTVSGVVVREQFRPRMSNPDYLIPMTVGKEAYIPLLDPVYPLTAGLSNRYIRRIMGEALTLIPLDLPEWHSQETLQHTSWPSFATALHWLHCPEKILSEKILPKTRLSTSTQGTEKTNADKAVQWKKFYTQAWERLACDELLAEQIALRRAQYISRQQQGRALQGNGTLQRQALKKFGYALTADQRRTLNEIETDMAHPSPMRRLLQGDVGSGKTLVAFMAMLRAIESGVQTALMAPTEILARQHATTLAAISPVPIEFLSSKVKGQTRKNILHAIAEGTASLIVGTHALMQKDVHYANLGLVVIDEQHRFGVEQRLTLLEKGNNVDILLLTATPIPRTLLLTHFGHMHVSQLKEKPVGRKPVHTSLHSLDTLDKVLTALERILHQGARIFWVCPLVSESETQDIGAAQARYTSLVTRFGPIVSLVHGQQDISTRDHALQDFATGRTRLLVATTIIEVGIDIPEATVMVIEHAERFGLAQLHQLRGRVGRGKGESYCLMLYSPTLSLTARNRLICLRDTEDGFLIADEDFRTRGGGEITGYRQSGTLIYRLAQPENSNFNTLLEIAHRRAQTIFTSTLMNTKQTEHVLPFSFQTILLLFGKIEADRLFSGG